MDNQEIYVVAPSRLDFPFLGRPMQWRRDELRDRLRASASLWASLRIRAAEFLEIARELGAALGKGPEFADLVFENSPFDVLPLGSVEEYDPLFGYFPPAMVAEYVRQFHGLPASYRQKLELRADDGLAASVLYAYESSFREGALRGYAIAINHC